jgi:hypothetical protein
MCKGVKGVTNAAYGAVGQISTNLSPIYEAIKTGELGKLNPIALAFAIKEQKYQYDELLKEIGNAVLYKKKIDKYLLLVSPDEFEECAKHHFDTIYGEFITLINMLMNTNSESVISKFKDSLNSLTDTIKVYNKHHEDKDNKAFTDSLKEKSDKIFVNSFPAWYRIELNSSINKVNMALDGLYLAHDIKLMAEKTKKKIEESCDVFRIPKSMKADPLVEPYIDEDSDEFYDSETGED